MIGFLAVWLLLLVPPWHHVWLPSQLLVSGQGVLTTPEQLGASDLETISLLDQFLETLDVSDQFTGKRPRKSKGGTHGNYADRQAFDEQQLQLYFLAGSPQAYSSGNSSQTQGGRNYIPKVRDQGSCSTVRGGRRCGKLAGCPLAAAGLRWFCAATYGCAKQMHYAQRWLMHESDMMCRQLCRSM
jgi:hypothetical protein